MKRNYYIGVYILLLCSVQLTAQNNSRIEFQAGTHIEVQTGASITADSVIMNGTYSGGGTINGGPVPVELISFTANITDKKITLNWQTATEINNTGFEIERSMDKTTFNKIGFAAGSGTSTEKINYSFEDDLISSNFKGKILYRLKQIDADGTYKYLNAIEVDVDFTPKEFALFQNYPNPFNPATIISYQIPVSGKVSLKVFDMLGREVVTLVDEVKEAGAYNVSFNGKSFTSGAYFYRFQSGDYIKINKMTLMK